MDNAKKILYLLGRVVNSKKTLADTLADKGEDAHNDDPLDDLVEKAGNYIPKSYIFVDENGNEVAGILVSQETVFDADVNDVREGKTFGAETGVKTGEKVIPSYHTSEGYTLIPNGSTFSIKRLTTLDRYDFTKLQAIICPYASSIAESVSAEKVVIDENVYEVKSASAIATITIDYTNKAIDFGITNNSGSICLIRYFTYKEIY